MCSSLGLHDFYRFWVEVEEITGRPPIVVFESTGHYHEAKKMSLRKVKTDAIDAFRLGELYPIFPFKYPFRRVTKNRNDDSIVLSSIYLAI